MAAQLQRRTGRDGDVVLARHAVEAVDHLERLLVAHDAGVGIILAEEPERAGVVRLHVIDYDIIDGAVSDSLADIAEIFGEELLAHTVHHRHLFIRDDIGIVADAARYGPHALKEGGHTVVNTDIKDVVLYLLHLVTYLKR